MATRQTAAPKYTSISVLRENAEQLKKLAEANKPADPKASVAKELEKLLALVNDGQWLWSIKEEQTVDSIRGVVKTLIDNKVDFQHDPEPFLRFLCDTVKGIYTKKDENKKETKTDKK